MESFAKQIEEHYRDYEEDNRLKSAFGKLEEIRTKELLSRFIPGDGKKVVDVGGATGVYSFYLAAQGHNVSLVDIVTKHIEIAKQRAGQVRDSAVPEAFVVADGRDLPFEESSVDVVLVHGPLYHFVKREDRLAVLGEAKRVLVDSGLLIAVTISRYAGLNYGIDEGLVLEDDYFAMVEREVRTGVRSDAPDRLDTFTEAYFHHPQEAFEEVVDSGFQKVQNFGVTGPGWKIPDFETRWNETANQARILEIAHLTENEPVLDSRTFTVGYKK